MTLRKDPVIEAEKYIQTISRHMGVSDIKIEIERDDQQVTFNLSSEKIALLIGKRGQTLNALQYLVHLSDQSWWR